MRARCWGLKGSVLSQAPVKLGEETYKLAAEMSVSDCSGCKAEFLISPPEFDTCLLSEGKQHQSHCSFDVKRCLISQALSFIFIFWHLKMPH